MGIFDSVKAAYESLEEAYYGFAEGLQAKGIPFMDAFVTPIESHGIPSLPVFLLLFVALAVAGLLVLTGTGELGTRSIAFTVVSGSQALDNVTIQVLYQDAIIAKGASRNGKLTLDHIPSAAVTVRFSKSGFKTLNLKSPASQTTLKADMKSTPPGTEDLPGDDGPIDYSQLLLIVLDARTDQPVAGAQVLYVSEADSGQKTTDAQGEVILQKAPLLNLRVSKEGYKTETLAVRDGGETRVYLEPLSGSFFGDDDRDGDGIPDAVDPDADGDGVPDDRDSDGDGIPDDDDDDDDKTDLSTQGVVSVVLNSTQGLPLDGHVQLYGTAGNLLGETDTAGGVAAFSAAVGTDVFVTAQVADYPLYDGSSRPQAVTEDTRFIVTLDKTHGGCSGSSCPSALDTVIRANDTQGNALYFTARIIKAPLIDLGRYEGERWEFKAEPGTYDVYIDADGYLSKTAALQVGKDNVFTLEKATAFSSAALTVSVQDEYGAVLSNARVTLFQNGKLAALSQTTDYLGKVVFDELALAAYDVRAESGGQNATVRASVEQGGSHALIRLTLHRAALRVNVITALDNSALPDAAIHVDSQGQPFGDKTSDVNGSANFTDVPAQVETHVVVSKTGFMPFIADVVLADGQTRVIPAVLIPQSATQGAKVDFIQIRTPAGQRVTQLKTGLEYVIELNATPAASASNQSLYFRVGSQSTTESDDATITEFTAADAVLKSTSYQPSSNCQDLSSHLVSSLDGYKWIELQFNQPAVRVASFLVSVKPSAQSNQQLSLYFATRTNSGLLSSRDPPDENGVPCYPRTYEYKVPIVQGSGGGTHLEPTPTPTPVPGTHNVLPSSQAFTSSVTIRYNPTSGKVEADASEIVLQVDAIYPRDSVPLVMDDASCAISFRVESQQADCFQVSRTALTFETKEYTTACPSYVKANDVVLQQDSAFLVLSAICGGPTSQLKIPIRIQAQAASSISTAPQQLDEGENTAKLLYVINQKQAGVRALTPLGGAGTIAVGSHSASALSWSGPGTLTLLDKDQTVGAWSYKSAPAYFDGIGSVGPRVETASDYLSCAQGWCTGPAALKALQFFKTEAQKTAAATMFRRSKGLNLGGGSSTPTPLPTASPSPSPSVSPTPTPSATATATASATAAATASASPSVTPTPSPTATASATASATATPTPITLHVNDVKTAANGNKIKLTDILQASGSTFAGFDILSSTGSVLTTATLQQGESYTGNGIQFQVTAITWSQTASQRAVQVQLSGSWQLSPAGLIQLEGIPASFERLDFAGPQVAPTSLSFASGEPFVFSTVVQVTENADKVFDALTIQRQGQGCGAQPGVWLVQASTTDGSNFQYTAEVMSLSQSPDSKPAGLRLCGFVHAKGKQIVVTKNPVLPSQNQASEEHTKPDTKIAIFSLAPLYKAQCVTMDKRIIELENEMSAIKTDLAQVAAQIKAEKTGIKNIASSNAEAMVGVVKDIGQAISKIPGLQTKECSSPCAACTVAAGCPDCIKCNGLFIGAMTSSGSASLAALRSEGMSKRTSAAVDEAERSATINDDFKPIKLTSAQNAAANSKATGTADLKAIQAILTTTKTPVTTLGTDARSLCSTTGGSCSEAPKATNPAEPRGALVSPFEEIEFYSTKEGYSKFFSFFTPPPSGGTSGGSSGTSSPAAGTSAQAGSGEEILAAAVKAAASAEAAAGPITEAYAKTEEFNQKIKQERAQYDRDKEQLAATKQKCDSTRNTIYEIPFGLWPQTARFWCASDKNLLKGIAEAEALQQAASEKIDAAQAQNEIPSQEIFDEFNDESDNLKALKEKAAKFQGCQAFCEAKPACIESYPSGRQFTQVIHLGLASDCTPYSKTAAQDLAKSFLATKIMQSLGPYAALASFSMGGSCSFAQGYFSKDNLGGKGG